MSADRCLLNWSVEIGVGEASLESELFLHFASIALQTFKFSSNFLEISLIKLFNFSSVVGEFKLTAVNELASKEVRADHESTFGVHMV